MSIAVLTQVYDEVRRLSIAGSVVACGDFRLRRLLAPLEQAGQKAPVFAKVAQAVSQLFDSTEHTSPAALLEVSALINAILYTQGETGIEGEWQALPGSTLDLRRQVAARELKPLLEALSTTGSGRLEVVRDAYARGLFQDLRLVLPAVMALDDVYPEIADLIADQVLPQYGTAIVPALRQRLDLQGRRRGDARRLRMLHDLDPAGTRPLVEQALESGSKEMRVAAIACLGDSAEDLAFLLEQSRARAKDVRAAALSALAQCSADDAAARLLEAIDGHDLELVVDALRGATRPNLSQHLLERCATAWQHLLQPGPPAAERGTEVGRYLALLAALRGRTDEAATTLLTSMFQQRQQLAHLKNAPGAATITTWQAQALAEGAPAAQRLLIDQHHTLTAEELHYAVGAACRLDEPAAVYERFCGYLDPGLLKLRREHREVLVATLNQPRYVADLDPRWLDAAIRHDATVLVLALARPGHAPLHDYLGKLWRKLPGKSLGWHEAPAIIRCMLSVQHREVVTAVCHCIDQLTKARHYSWEVHLIAPLLAQLPRSALPDLEAWLPTLPERYLNEIVGYVAAQRH